jgi:translocation protein SEC63
MHFQAVPLSARKAGGGNSEGIAPFLQLPHFSEATVKKIARKVFPSVYAVSILSK